MKPFVTILIDAFNHERYVEQAIVSAIEQDFPSAEYEILVVDDGSTDRTPELVRRFAPRVRVLTKKNGGQASAFNAAFPEIRGEIVAFLDGDDWFAPNKLNSVTDALELHPEAAVVGHGFYEFHEETNEVTLRAPAEGKFFHLATPEAAREAVLGWRFLFTSTLTVRRAVLRRIMPVPETLIFCAEGPIVMAGLAGGAFVLPHALMHYRGHPGAFHLADSGDTARHCRMIEMIERAFEVMETTLIRLGVPPGSAQALLYQDWIRFSLLKLRTHGGSRLDTFRTEMRRFRLECSDASMRYRLFKQLVMGPATLLLPPRSFYNLRDWYGQRNLGRLRERLLRSH